MSSDGSATRPVVLISAAALWTDWESNARQRPSDESLAPLVASIRAHGMLEPVGVRKDRRPDGPRPEGEELVVVFGFRRVEAARLIDPAYLVPCIDAGAATPDGEPWPSDAKERLRRALANLAENTGRSDLSSWEEARRLALLRELSKEAGERLSGRSLAKLVGISEAQCSRYLKVWAWCQEPGHELQMAAWQNGCAFDAMLRACEGTAGHEEAKKPRKGRANGATEEGGDDGDEEEIDEDAAAEAVKWATRWGEGIKFVNERVDKLDGLFQAGAQWALRAISVAPKEPPAAVLKGKAVAKRGAK